MTSTARAMPLTYVSMHATLAECDDARSSILTTRSWAWAETAGPIKAAETRTPPMMFLILFMVSLFEQSWYEHGQVDSPVSPDMALAIFEILVPESLLIKELTVLHVLFV